MQGLVNFAGTLGYFIAVLLPTFCYLAALGCFLFAGWGFWMQAHPQNPFYGRPWIPVVSLVLSGVFASYDKFLTMANASAGTNVQVSIGALTSYTPPIVNGNALGNTPAEALVNIVTIFQAFFQSFGAMVVFFAIVSWRAVVNGHSRRTHGGCMVQFVFGVMMINVLTVTQWLTGVFQVA